MRFINKIMISIGAALLLLTLGVTARASTLEDVLKSTFKIYNGYEGVCSAVAVSPTQLVTAAHCIPTQLNLRNLSVGIVKLDSNLDVVSEKFVKITVVRTNRDDDTAFVELKDPDEKFAVWADIAPEFGYAVGERVLAVGYPRMGELTVTDGLVTGVTRVPLPGAVGFYMKATVPVMGGSSGGGVYSVNGTDYKLIGTTTGHYRDVSFQSYFSTLEAVQKVVKNLLKGHD